MPEVFRVAQIGTGYLAVMARPGIDEPLRATFMGLAKLGVNVVVSLLEPSEAEELSLSDEEAQCEGVGIVFRRLPIRDRGLPSDAKAISQFSKWAHARIVEGCGLVFHCRAGIGRSGMLAASVLLREGLTVREAFACISAARGLTVPDTPGQLEWVEQQYEVITGKRRAATGPP
jgi:protein-tyrosine phosphatase